MSYCNEYLGIRYSNFHRPKSLSLRIVRGDDKIKIYEVLDELEPPSDELPDEVLDEDFWLSGAGSAMLEIEPVILKILNVRFGGQTFKGQNLKLLVFLGRIMKVKI